MKTKPKKIDRPTIKVKPRDYQPTKAEMKKEFSTEATPEFLAGA